MDNGSVAGAIIMAGCCFACALTFCGIAFWARKSKKPINFWSGTKVPCEKVTDIPAYNRANAAMWIGYSLPYWLAGLVACFGYLGDIFTLVSVALLILAFVPGLFLLVRRYREIEKMYVIK